ncbi:hypothetical protein GOC09_24055 [Sinorhizobium meliloti]|nr:hypothetical protein [Sinorhizobium meliloti]MDW9836697.1 hypothetical protein [Sinorhizobium meliloti]MDX0041056.1 hypothetical protein [Sinorhizobium meliloti]MDX0090263.1 hypothetical protein [Sinorhizobium meliloti]
MSENIDIEIADFRGQHDGALMSKAHPEHEVRMGELSALYERKFTVGDLVAPLPSKALSDAEYRAKHTDALNDRAHPEHDLRVKELAEANGVAVQDEQNAGVDFSRLAEPAQQLTDYDFSSIQMPVGLDVYESPELENYAREWLLSGEVSPAEGSALANVYAESLNWTPDQIGRMADQTGRELRSKYGEQVGAAASAALKVADELPGLGDFLESSGLINNLRVVDRLIQAAETRGYFKANAGT